MSTYYAKCKSNIPNILTISRIAIIPLFIMSFYITHRWACLSSAFIFVLAGLTDFADGYLARYWSVQSRLGSVLDPIADKVIVTAAIMMLIHVRQIHSIHIIAAIIIICREILISGLREMMASQNIILSVNYIAKIKTFVQMTTITILILNQKNCLPSMHNAGIFLLWTSSALTLYSGLLYFYQCIPYFKKKDGIKN